MGKESVQRFGQCVVLVLFLLYKTMAKEFSMAFYKSKQWVNARNAYMNSVRGWCEECLKHGMFNRAEIVHHIIELTPENINDPRVNCSFENLKAVCRECHAKEHGAKQKRFVVDELGRVKAK